MDGVSYSHIFAPALRSSLSPHPSPVSAERLAPASATAEAKAKPHTTASHLALPRTGPSADALERNSGKIWRPPQSPAAPPAGVVFVSHPHRIRHTRADTSIPYPFRRAQRCSSHRPTLIHTESRLWQLVLPTNGPTPPCPSRPRCPWGSNRFPSRRHPMLRSKRSGSTPLATRSQGRTVSGCSLKADRPGGTPRASRPKDLVRQTATRAWSVD